MDEVVEEHREQLKSLSSTTGGPVGSGDAVANVNTNHLGGWHQSSRVIRDSRERRVTLSATTANQLLDLQDLLGYDQPSKAVEWLMKAAANSIAELPSSKSPFPDTPNKLRDDKHASEQIFDSADVELDDDPNFQQNKSQHLSMSKSSWNSASENSESSGLTLSWSEIRDNSKSSRLGLSRSELRVKARERARERAAKEFLIAQNVNHISNNCLGMFLSKQNPLISLTNSHSSLSNWVIVTVRKSLFAII